MRAARRRALPETEPFVIEKFDHGLCACRSVSVNTPSLSVDGSAPATGHVGCELHIPREADASTPGVYRSDPAHPGGPSGHPHQCALLPLLSQLPLVAQ